MVALACFTYLLFCSLKASVVSFIPLDSRCFRNSVSPATGKGLFGISEWRDLIFDYPGTGNDRRLGAELGALPKEINLLPFPFSEVLLQSETKQLRLYEERFTKLFEDTMEHHCQTVAMGLLAEAGIIQTVPLCEIEAYNRLDGFGIFVTIRAVGRAQLMEVIQASYSLALHFLVFFVLLRDGISYTRYSLACSYTTA